MIYNYEYFNILRDTYRFMIKDLTHLLRPQRCPLLSPQLRLKLRPQLLP